MIAMIDDDNGGNAPQNRSNNKKSTIVNPSDARVFVCTYMHANGDQQNKWS
jgi:hypothetical protein